VLVTGKHEDALPGDPDYEKKVRALLINGKVEASTYGDMETQMSVAILPMIARPRAKDVLVIGFGSGTTVGTALSFPGVRATCCELEPAVVRAGPLFAEVNHRPWESPSFRLVQDDGRSWVQGTSERYDLILSEPSNPWMVGVSNLFTQEFYVAARARLKSGGMLAQWLQTYTLSLREYALVLRTLRSVFPHVAVMRVSNADTIVLGSSAPILGSASDADAAQALLDSAVELHASMQKHLASRDARTLIIAHCALDDRGLERLLARDGGTALHTDLDLRLEFDAPRWLFGPPDVEGAIRPSTALLASYDVAFLRDLWIQLGCGAEQIDALRFWLGALKAVERRDACAQVVELALTYAPDDPRFLMEQLLVGPSASEEGRQLAEHLMNTSPEYAFQAARTLAQGGATAQALPILEGLRAKHPQSVQISTALVTVYAALGREADARKLLDEALAIDPFDPLARDLKSVMDEKR
jgi:spermidine synthase